MYRSELDYLGISSLEVLATIFRQPRTQLNFRHKHVYQKVPHKIELHLIFTKMENTIPNNVKTITFV